MGERETFRAMLYGAPTFPADLPKTGATTFRSSHGPIPTRAADHQYRYTMDWATGEFTSVTIVPCEDPNQCPNGNLGEVRLTGRLVQGSQATLLGASMVQVDSN